MKEHGIEGIAQLIPPPPAYLSAAEAQPEARLQCVSESRIPDSHRSHGSVMSQQSGPGSQRTLIAGRILLALACLRRCLNPGGLCARYYIGGSPASGRSSV
jgi:hypothetical protein